MSFLALLPNDLANAPALLQNLRFFTFRFRIARRLRHRMVALLSRLARWLSFRFAIPLGPYINATRTDNKVISSRLRVQHAFVIGPCITGLNGRFRRLRPVDYDVKVSWLSESRQRKST